MADGTILVKQAFAPLLLRGSRGYGGGGRRWRGLSLERYREDQSTCQKHDIAAPAKQPHPSPPYGKFPPEDSILQLLAGTYQPRISGPAKACLQKESLLVTPSFRYGMDWMETPARS